MNLGERIYIFRTERKMSQDELARRIKVSRQSISKWENNLAVPDLNKIVKLSEELQVTLDELVKGEESKKKCEETEEILEVKKNRDSKRWLMSPVLILIITVLLRLIIAAIMNETYYLNYESAIEAYYDLRKYINVLFDGCVRVSIIVFVLSNVAFFVKNNTTEILRIIVYNVMCILGVFVTITIFFLCYPELDVSYFEYHSSFHGVYLNIILVLGICLIVYIWKLFNRIRRKEDSMKKIKKILSIMLAMLLSINSTCLFVEAAEGYTLEEAIEYLNEHKQVQVIKEDQTVAIEYEFQTDEDLIKAANYILENGFGAFNNEVTKRLQENFDKVDSEKQLNTRDADVLSKIVLIPREDGIYTISEVFGGIADFPNISEGIYTSNYWARLTYQVEVENGVMKKFIDPVTFEMESIAYGNFKSVVLNRGMSSTGASVTANYKMTRTYSEEILGIVINVFEDETTDWFVLYAYFE